MKFASLTFASLVSVTLGAPIAPQELQRRQPMGMMDMMGMGNMMGNMMGMGGGGGHNHMTDHGVDLTKMMGGMMGMM
ncbi:hypothetical protein DSO57_1033012 [Entomophthora muscae]|uniref:Uncharacterized protein n=2 Tax=Entomophthora muscae TaxID=34485 RepID=A0ACC2TLZ0_9FUNG|nr:hypothetical protein DSO57_1012049 [Entomophthora muscae]KAJ9075729.1 hypothetical protein DSO57_1033012 [Entomophthora muscae]